MPDPTGDSAGFPSTGIQTAEASAKETDGGGALSARESGPYEAEFASKEWEQQVKPEDLERLRLQRRITLLASSMEGRLDSNRTTDGVRDNYGMFKKMYEGVLEATGKPWKWTAENEKQAKDPKAYVAGADWCGIFAAYVLTCAGQPTQWKMWSKQALHAGIQGRRLAKKGVDRIEPGDICVIPFRTRWKDGKPVKVHVEHHCIVLAVNPDGKTIRVVNGNAAGQSITIGDENVSDVGYFYKGT